MNYKTESLIENLIKDAITCNIKGSPDSIIINRCLAQNKPIPDHLLPGRMIMRLSKEDRFRLNNLKSRDMNRSVHNMSLFLY